MDKTCRPDCEAELRAKQAEITELKQSHDKLFDENLRLGQQCEKLLKEKSELDRKIGFLEGQIEAYQYCMNCRR